MYSAILARPHASSYMLCWLLPLAALYPKPSVTAALLLDGAALLVALLCHGS